MAKHWTPQEQLPPLAYKTVSTTTWGASPNTCTISDVGVKANSSPIIWVTGTTPSNGRWSWTCAAPSTYGGNGTITITSTDPESSTLPISYVIL